MDITLPLLHAESIRAAAAVEFINPGEHDGIYVVARSLRRAEDTSAERFVLRRVSSKGIDQEEVIAVSDMLRPVSGGRLAKALIGRSQSDSDTTTPATTPTVREAVMDPNETLRQIAATHNDASDNEESLGYIEALRCWLEAGGLEPTWEKCPEGTRLYRLVHHEHTDDPTLALSGCGLCWMLVHERKERESDLRHRRHLVAFAAEMTALMRDQHVDPTILAAVIVADKLDDIQNELDRVVVRIESITEGR